MKTKAELVKGRDEKMCCKLEMVRRGVRNRGLMSRRRIK